MKKTTAFIYAIIACLTLTASSAMAWSMWEFPWSDPGVDAFVMLGEKSVDGLTEMSVEDKRSTVMEICETLSDSADYNWFIDATPAVSTTEETVLKFPFLDMNMDGINDEASCNVEFWHVDNNIFLEETGKMQYMAALPWSVGVYTENNKIKVSMRSPKASVMVFMREENDIDYYKWLADYIGITLDTHIRFQLSMEHFNTYWLEDMDETAISEAVLQDIEERLGVPINLQLAAPTVSFPADGMSVEQVVEVIKQNVNAKTVPDLNMDGDTTDLGDESVLPELFNNFFMGLLTFDDMLGVLATAPDIWNMGGTFQQWKTVKTYAPADLNTELQQISICQPFYATTALNSTGAYHQTIMPCRVMVWEEDGNISISISNPELFFAAFFFDANDNMSEDMLNLFSIFPTFVYDEIATLINNSLAEIGSTASFALH